MLNVYFIMHNDPAEHNCGWVDFPFNLPLRKRGEGSLIQREGGGRG